MRNIITKILIPSLFIVLWIAVCVPIATRSEGFNYFMFWIIAGIPFGFRYMFFKLMSKGYGISGTIGAFALNIIIGGIIGGIMLMTRIVQVFVDAVRMIISKA
ncbi:MAG: ABC transporter permease [Lachnospiraceae bacterium]|nr:ABC transporter permease [Lachnospiraceae bacterium]